MMDDQDEIGAGRLPLRSLSSSRRSLARLINESMMARFLENELRGRGEKVDGGCYC